MINYFYSAIFGIIQGITEFVPISSSGHLVILHDFISLPIQNQMAFDVILHFGSLLAVIYYFKKDIASLLTAWLRSFAGKRNDSSRLSWLIILSTIPAALVGFLFNDLIENKFRSILVVAAMLVIVGILFIIFEKFSQKNKEYKNIGWREALIIGLAQIIAFIPGTSRSGITIIAGLSANLKREAAVRFSFLLSIPIIFGAVIVKMPSIIKSKPPAEEMLLLIVGFIFSYLAGFLAIKYFMRFIKNHSLNIFAVYRFVLAAIILVYFFIFQS
ncbi:undecaprenyl-diphosphatase UppP [Candidatus Falkowbacteria bacterium]|nr:MAG: undecaprenyl-diphosphatase UppP [Candidatus Falkowbacteria bacterium]